MAKFYSLSAQGVLLIVAVSTELLPRSPRNFVFFLLKTYYWDQIIPKKKNDFERNFTDVDACLVYGEGHETDVVSNNSIVRIQ